MTDNYNHGGPDGGSEYVSIRRPLYKTQTFRNQFMKTSSTQKSVGEAVKQKARDACACTPSKRKKCLFSFLPFLKIMSKYKWRSDLPNDIIAGLTVGIMQLPQGMAYSMLADMPPVVGLYMSFFPVLIYFIFGTSKQISMGTVAVVSLMTGGIVSTQTNLWREARGLQIENTTMMGLNGSDGIPGQVAVSDDEIRFKISVAATVCFLTGLIQIGMGIFRVGFLTTYMSDSLVSGFTTGAAVHVFTSQVKYVFGIKIPRFPNLFQIIKTYEAIIRELPNTNLPEMGISFICIVIIYLVKVQVNQRFKAKLKVPIPVELIVVVIGTTASHFGGFVEMWGIRTVGHIPAGLPVPAPPSFVNVSSYGTDCIAIAIVAFAQSVSLAVVMANKHHYDIDSNKELVAYGFGNVFGSFFSCYPFAASVSRSSVQDSAGGKTQVTSIFSACMVLIVILFIGPLFQSLPNCVLSAIIMVALRSMFLQILELRSLWRISIYDCAIWIVTFVCVVVLHVDMGLMIGIVFSFFTVVVRTQLAKASSLEKVSDVEVLQKGAQYEKAEKYNGIKVVGFNAPVYYANADIFMRHVYTVAGAKPERILKKMKKLEKQDLSRLHSQQQLINEGTTVLQLEPKKNGITINPEPPCNNEKMNKRMSLSGVIVEDPRPFHHIVIDCTAMHFIDPVGVKIFKQIFTDYNNVGISVFLGNVRDEMWYVLEQTKFVETYHDCIYLTTYDAVTAASTERKANDLVQDVESDLTEPTIEDKLLPVQS
ncbi:prestin-like isoform X1 [Haliotis rufescens]|uniref:prestin-like isoform X1 n=1 Tax=Haliotis rufescens TaxID=6454 RepID=UPI00201E76CB|nr:prestin-like isoform X1 [Haliotis rufescens]